MEVFYFWGGGGRVDLTFSLLLNIAQGGIFKKLALYLVLLKLTVLKLRELDSYKYSTNFPAGI